MDNALVHDQTSARSSELDDELALVSAAQGGDRGAFDVLFARYKDAVFTFVLRTSGCRDEAEDVLQETFCRAWSAIGSFKGRSRVVTWLYRIAASVSVDRSRTAQRQTRLALEMPIRADERPVHASLAQDAVKRAMPALPVSHRQLVVLCDIEGFTSKEAAQVVGCSAISARVRLSRAHNKLRQLLSEDLGEVE